MRPRKGLQVLIDRALRPAEGFIGFRFLSCLVPLSWERNTFPLTRGPTPSLSGSQCLTPLLSVPPSYVGHVGWIVMMIIILGNHRRFGKGEGAGSEIGRTPTSDCDGRGGVRGTDTTGPGSPLWSSTPVVLEEVTEFIDPR